MPLAIADCCDVDHAQRIGHVGFGSTEAKTGHGFSAELVTDGVTDAVGVAVAVLVEEAEAVAEDVEV